MNPDPRPYPTQPTAPGGWDAETPAGSGGSGSGPRRHRLRRRLGAIVVGTAVVAGGVTGATTALLLGGNRSATTTAASVTASSTASTTSSSTAATVIAANEPALVDIIATGTSSSASSYDPYGGSTTTESAGTGMIIESDGLVLTNAHVIAGATKIQVIEDGTTKKLTATLVGEDAAKDVALIKITGASGLPTVTLGSSSGLVAGDSVLAIGNALNLATGGFTASTGIVSALDRSITTDNNENLTGLIQTDAAISSGDSGGVLLNSAGQVIGMNTAAATSSDENTAQDVGFAIPVNELKTLIPQLEKGSIGTVTFGSGSTSSTGSTGSDGSTPGYGGY